MNTDKGLFTPYITNADYAGLVDINAKVKDFAERARAGKLTAGELTVCLV